MNKDDETIYTIIENFLSASKETVWLNFNPKSYIFKTVGVQALFDVLKRILSSSIVTDKEYFREVLEPAVNYDFSSNVIQASGIGRKDIRNALLLATKLITPAELRPEDLQKINSLKAE